MDFIFQEKSHETVSDTVELASCPPEAGDMEQLIAERGDPSLPSGAPLQASALSVGLDSCPQPGITHLIVTRTIPESSFQFSPFLVIVNPTRGIRL